MASKPQALLILLPLLLLLLLSPVRANDILEILKPQNDYSTFTNYLTEANLIDEINRRDNITVLAVKNSEMSAITSLPANIRKNVMSIHVLLGYYDPYIISHLHEKTSLVPTLFQSTGLATDQNDYVKIAKKPLRQIVFGPGTPGSSLDSYLISVVGTKSDKISVLHVSDPIIPPGIESAKKAPAPVAPPTASAPAKQETPAPAPRAATAPANAPEARASAPSAGKVSEAPPPSVGKASAPHSSASRVVVGATMGLAMGVVLFRCFLS